MMLHHGRPDDHQPFTTQVSTISVTCARTGPEAVIEEHNSMRQHTLADVRAWVAELDRLGAAGDLPLPEADGLTVTLDAKL
jgi:hypothetical protein